MNRKVLVRLKDVDRTFDDAKKSFITNFNLDIFEGEFISILGPSGCGKTTILRLISGLEPVSDGKIFINDIDVTNVPAARRPVNTIFQNFALFPHLTVFDNVAFGLKMRHVDKSEIKKRVRAALKTVELTGLENRFPSQLSGGQQQRVAIARGIIMNHNLLLLDESLASLDLNLKREMQTELKSLQEKLGLTFVYVTHDQDEALTMSDRIVIMDNGKIIQLGTPEEVYNHPVNDFVKDFVSDIDLINFKKSRMSRYEEGNQK